MGNNGSKSAAAAATALATLASVSGPSAKVTTVTAQITGSAAAPQIITKTATVEETSTIAQAPQVVTQTATIEQTATVQVESLVTVSEKASTPAPQVITVTPTPPQGAQSPAVANSVISSTPSPAAAKPTPAASQSTIKPSATVAGAAATAGESGGPVGQQSSIAEAGTTNPTALPAVAASPATMSDVPGLVKEVRGPFTQQIAVLGGVPTKGLDVPITVVFLILFLTGAATHFTIHELNGKRGHKFHISDMVFDFCMVRTVTTTMRIVWAFRPLNNSIVLAAQIFENAGVVVLFAVNILFTQRILRALHPKFGWSKPVNTFFLAMLVSVGLIIIINIIALTSSFFTQDEHLLKISRGFILFGASYTMTLSIFPILVLLPAGLVPGKIERFGAGPFRFKVFLLLFATFLFGIGAMVRLAAGVQEHPASQPAAIDSKVVFYLTGFVLEIIVVALYAVCRIDLLFHVPDGCTGPGDYAAGYAPRSDEEEFFQEVDVKMRMDESQLDLAEPPAAWQGNNYMASPRSSQAPYMSPASNQGPFMSPASNNRPFTPVSARAAVVEEAMRDLEMKSGIEGQYLNTGDSEVMLYAFKVKRPYSDPAQLAAEGQMPAQMPPIGMARPPIAPPRASSYYGTSVNSSEPPAMLYDGRFDDARFGEPARS